jgi:hypothetical protein
MIGFISTSVTSSLNHTFPRAIADLHNLQFAVTHALGFSVFTSLLLATELNTETSNSNRYEVFLHFLLSHPGTSELNYKLRLLLTPPVLLLTPPAYDCPQTTFVVPYKRSARTNRKHVT